MTQSISPATRSRPANRRDQLLDAAELLARHNGYHGFSFRDVAARVGVKSASVHHHFPTKPDLVTALADRYRVRFLDRLGPADERGALLRLIAGFRDALTADDKMCLCGLLGAEADGLPQEVSNSVNRFFEDLVAWTAQAIGTEKIASRDRAETIVAGLEGAMILARSMRDPELFDRVAARLLEDQR